ncbi:MAG: 2-dehydro-3-deoxygalactonokinase, partial [Kordiimonadaceae bacterium]|nr:2-dehydro-3-deoxygalactonokinase [Kordiimonadaceae bacterium]
MPNIHEATLIGLDWGTTSLRAHLIGSDGVILKTLSSPDGILSSEGKKFDEVFERIVGPWLKEKPNLPVIASGMITSRNGWLETPYLQLPACVSDFANALTKFKVSDNQNIHFVTGTSYENELGAPDIMRGEETQIIGLMPENKNKFEVYLLPGTHSKWAVAEDGKIKSFMSYMTGEVFALLTNHSILGTLMSENKSPLSDGFLRGVKTRIQSDASLLHQVFSARTLTLFDQLPNNEISDYLSGILIGEEVKSAKHNLNIDVSQKVQIIGRGDLTMRYSLALNEVQIAHDLANEHAAAMGLYK